MLDSLSLYLLKGYGFGLLMINAQFQMTIFGVVMPIISESHFGLESGSIEYQTFYSQCYSFYCFTKTIGVLTSGLLIYSRKRFPILVSVDLLIILLNFLFLWTSNLFIVAAARGLMGFLCGLTSGIFVVLIAELNTSSISGTFLNISGVTLATGGFSSVMVNYMCIYFDFGWIIVVAFSMLLTTGNLVFLLTFGRKETPRFQLMVMNSQEDCLESLRYYFNDEEIELAEFEVLKKEKIMKTREPSLFQALTNKNSFKRNFLGVAFALSSELLGTGTISSNWTEVGTLLLSSSFASPTDSFINTFVCLLLFSRIFFSIALGKFLNHSSRRVPCAILQFSAAILLIYLFLSFEYFGGAFVLVPGILSISLMTVAGGSASIVGTELCDKQLLPITKGLSQSVVFLYSLVYSCIELDCFFPIFAAWGTLYGLLFLSAYTETFKKNHYEVSKVYGEYQKI